MGVGSKRERHHGSLIFSRCGLIPELRPCHQQRPTGADVLFATTALAIIFQKLLQAQTREFSNFSSCVEPAHHTRQHSSAISGERKALVFFVVSKALGSSFSAPVLAEIEVNPIDPELDYSQELLNAEF
jgi:hypothetical protein